MKYLMSSILLLLICAATGCADSEQNNEHTSERNNRHENDRKDRNQPPHDMDKRGESLPEWDQLTSEQQESLMVMMRERWNSRPDKRAHMMEHALRWESLSPEQQLNARRGEQRFEGMSPEQRERARVFFHKTENMTPEERREFHHRWKSMSSEERREWVRDNPPPSPPTP